MQEGEGLGERRFVRGRLVEAAGRQEAGVARGVAGVRVGAGREARSQCPVIRFGVWAEFAAGFEKVGAEGYVAVYVFGFEARALGGEAVG